ncbi:hypothetical protein CHH27_10755 [Labrenzia sp. VG12]|nr:hypothetical protein CHH27_10755 [Labrenzia sp. VG12]
MLRRENIPDVGSDISLGISKLTKGILESFKLYLEDTSAIAEKITALFPKPAVLSDTEKKGLNGFIIREFASLNLCKLEG